MPICPDCHFENPDSNNFCQKCGTSLAQTNSQQYGANIPFPEPQCTANKILLWGIIAAQNQQPELALANVGVSQTATCEEPNANHNYSQLQPEPETSKSSSLSLAATQKYLDGQQRYSIETVNDDKSLFVDSDWNFLQVKVTDEQPRNPSYLKNIQQQQPELFAQLSQKLDSSYLATAEYWNIIGIPTIALPYILLQTHYPVIPQLYDAWQEASQGIILVEDRSPWQLLSQVWAQPNLDLLQLLWTLEEITKLWTPLSQVGCATSLLVANNLRLDEDQSLCLQQLYMDNPNYPPKLSDLAQKLQHWLIHSPQFHYEQLNQLLQAAIAGTITTIEQFRAQMHELVTSEVVEVTINSDDDNYDELSDFHLLLSEEDPEAESEIYDSFIYDTDSDEQPTALLPMELDQIDHASGTDIGKQRDHNEDFFGIDTIVTSQENSNHKKFLARNLYLVCDGMGGHAAGEVASAMAVETIQNYFQTHWQEAFPDEAAIKESILLANQTLCEINSSNSRSGSGRMGTTLVMALIQDTKLAIAHVGDSRIYRLTRQRGLEQLTVDHEVGQREINRGVEPEIAYGRPDAYQLTQALGPRENKHIRPSIDFFELQEDCLLLLCSDGLSDHQLLEKHGESYLKPLISSGADLKSGLSQLIDFANQHNGHDNITAILIRIKLKPRI
ncbi:MAG TPA: serine/threonine phosphatase [Xenococcaceae cyanobacterium]|jgi:protein phosphatase